MSSDWADYRERVGEFLFRSYVASSSKLDQKALARQEFASALRLRPNSPRAQRFIGYLDAGLTPIGLPYDHDIAPKVALFEHFIGNYNGHRDWMFERLAATLTSAADVTQQKALMKANVAFHADMAGAATTDLEIAKFDAEQAKQRLDFAKGQVDALRARLETLDEARLHEHISILDALKAIGEVVVAVAGIAAAVMTAGTSLMATFAAVGDLVGDIDTLVKSGADLLDLSDVTDPKLTAEGKAAVGDIKKLVEHTTAIVDAAKAVYHLAAAYVENDSDAPEPQVLSQQVQASFEVALATFAVERGALAKQGAQQKLVAYDAAKNSLDSLLAGQAQSVGTQVAIARALLRQFEVYNDLFVRYHFYVNRAFDLYTLTSTPKTRGSRFDFGYVSPDDEMDAFASLTWGRPDAQNRIAGLIGKYLTSLNGVLPVSTVAEYEGYQAKLDSVGQVWSITSPAVLDALRVRGTATIALAQVDLDDPDVAELKIQHLRVALLGAKAQPANANLKVFQVKVTHPGQATNIRATDKAVVAVTAPFVHDSVNATLSAIELHDLETAVIDTSEEPRSWGRSPMAAWQIRVTTSADKLDLSGLTELQFGVRYGHVRTSTSARRKIVVPVK